MAKAGKKRDRSEKSAGTDQLEGAVKTFARGDYARAKLELLAKANDPSLSEGQREEARELAAATGLERGTLWVGAACVGLLMLVIIVTVLTQP